MGVRQRQSNLKSTSGMNGRRWTEALLEGEKRLLEMVALGNPLSSVLTDACLLVEQLCPPLRCSIMLVDRWTGRLVHAAAPSLPREYTTMLDGMPVDAQSGGRHEVALDLAAQAGSAELREVLLKHKIRGCCSTPILSRESKLVGTFALLSSEPSAPNAQHRRVIQQITHLISIAVERQSSEEAMRRGEAYFAEAQRLSRTGSFGWRVTTGERDWSDETFRILGYDRSMQPSLELMLRRVHPEDLGFVRGIIGKAVGEVRPYDLEHRMLMEDGTVKHVRVMARPARTESGEVEFVGAVMDITDRKLAQLSLECALRDMQGVKEQFQLAINTIPGLVWTAQPDGYIDFLNQRWLDYTGLTHGEASGWGWRQAIHPEDLAGLEEYWRGVLAARSAGETEARLRRFDGSYRWFIFRAVPLIGSDGLVDKWYGQTTDIDDRRVAEEQLRRSEVSVRAAKARFEGILAIADDAIISVDAEHRIVLFNQGAERVFGYDKQEVLGRPLDLLIPTRFAGAHEAHMDSFAGSGEVARPMGRRREVFGVRKNGEEFPAEASISMLELGTEQVFTVILRDITDRRKSAEALRASEHLARGQLDALTRTLNAISHESEAEKFLEHVLRMIGQQLGGQGLGIWELREEVGRVRLVANYEGERLHLPSPDEVQGSQPMSLASRYHPVWTEFFQSGTRCVLGELGPDTVMVRFADSTDPKWHDWSDDSVVSSVTRTIAKRLHAMGVVGTLAVPLVLAGKVAGLISVRFTERRQFRPEELELTRALAHQAMLAVQLTRLSQQSRMAAVAAERNRVARDIHDTLAQGFTGVIVQLEAASDAIARKLTREADDHLRRAGDLARESLREARRSVLALRPLALERQSLRQALATLLGKMVVGTGIRTEITVEGSSDAVAPEVECNILRIGQEALTNAIRYARATRISARLAFSAETLELTLQDDGCGFDTTREHDGFGLLGMQERAREMGGLLAIESAPGSGTTIRIQVPLSHPEEVS